MNNFEDNNDEFATLDSAVAAVLTEPIPPGPPESVAFRLWERQRLSVAEARCNGKARSTWQPMALAACVILCGIIFCLPLGTQAKIAWADVAREFELAKSIQFRQVMYAHAFGDKKRSEAWRNVSVIESCFKSPGFRREVSFDYDGIPWQIETEDAIKGVTLKLNIAQKEAFLTEAARHTEAELRKGLPTNLVMLEHWLEYGKVVKELGSREVRGKEVVALRLAHGQREADFWIDRASRRIVRFQEPTADKYDPDNDPVAKKVARPNAESIGQELKGWVWTDIVYDPPLDGAQFVTTPPDGYTVKKK